MHMYHVSAVLMDMFVDLYCHVTSELTYEAEVAELEYSIEITRRGLSLIVEGFSHKLHVRYLHTATVWFVK